jgi:hypothetical protein
MVSVPLLWCPMKIHWLLLSLLPYVPLHALQHSTPQGALEELASTTKPEVLVSHLPEPVQKSIDALPRLKKQAILDQLLELKSSQLGNNTVRPAESSDGWEIINSEGNVAGRVRLENAFISGLDAMLPLQIEINDSSQSIIVTMHLEDNEWRIDGYGPWEKNDLGLAKLVHEPTEQEKNEAAARDDLMTICTAATRWANTHPSLGFPSSLSQLIAHQSTKFPYLIFGSLDPSFAADPLIKHGYLFRFLKTDVGDGTPGSTGSFNVTAIPDEFGQTGTRSFFIDDACRIHVTTENRLANEHDLFSVE